MCAWSESANVSVFVSRVLGQHLDVSLLLVNGMATWVLIQHKAKKKGMKKRKLLCTAEQTDVGGGFSCPLYLYLHLAQGQGAERCVLKMHVSSLIWAVSFGSVSSLLKGTQMALHDLVNLSWDYLLNTNKQTKKKQKKNWARCQRLLPWLVACVHPFPLLVATMGSSCLMFTLLPKEQAHVTIVVSTKGFSLVLHFRYRFILLQCFSSERSLRIDLVYLCDRPPLMVAMLVAMLYC